MDQREAAELTAIVLCGITRGMRGEFSAPEDLAEYGVGTVDIVGGLVISATLGSYPRP